MKRRKKRETWHLLLKGDPLKKFPARQLFRALKVEVLADILKKDRIECLRILSGKVKQNALQQRGRRKRAKKV